MARSTKKSHKIVVDNVEYRWRVSLDKSCTWIGVSIWPSNEIGAVIVCRLKGSYPWVSKEPETCIPGLGMHIVVTNQIVKQIISYAKVVHEYNPDIKLNELKLGRIDKMIDLRKVASYKGSWCNGYPTHKEKWLNRLKTKICILDGHTLNPDDLSWDGFKQLGELTVYDRSPPELVVQRAKKSQIILSNKVVLSREIIEQLPELKYIGVLATGYNNIDIDAAKEKGIVVSNVPTYGSKSVAQFVMSHILNFAQSIAHHDQTVKNGKWEACPDFCYWETPLIELAGKTMGILGFGRIGQETAKLAQAFDMKVIVHNRSEIKAEGIEQVGLETLFQESDFMSLHCPLTEETENIINGETISLMKPTAYLINTSRGPLIDEAALANALNAGEIAGASLDVLSKEPPNNDNPLLSAKNCTITPHIAWATREARERLMGIAVENVKAFLDGKPQNVIT